MNKEQAAHELNQIHIVYAKQLTQIGNALSSSGEDGVILWLCQQEGDIFAVDIIDHFGLTPGRVAKNKKKLEEKDYISRHHNCNDLRKSCIYLTESGSAYARKLYRRMNDAHLQIIDEMGEENIRIFLYIIKEIIHKIDNGMDISQLI